MNRQNTWSTIRGGLTAFGLVCLTWLMTGCQSEDTTSLIPANSKALMSVDVMQNGLEKMVTKLLPSVDGLDYSTPVYGFIDGNGLFGMAVALSDNERVEATLHKLEKQGTCGKLESKFDCKWTLLKSGFLLGMKENRMLIMGPVVASEKESLRVLMKQSFDRKQEESVVETPLFAQLSELKGGVAVVTPLSLIPSYGKIPFRLLLPAEVKSEDVLLSAVMTSDANGLKIEGSLTSGSATVQQKLAGGASERISGALLSDAVYTTSPTFFLTTNLQGKVLVDALKSDKDLRLKLTGLNLNIDADMMMRAIAGDVFVQVAEGEEQLGVSLRAELGNTDFLADVPYWKSSLTDGMRLTDEGRNAYCLAGSGVKLHFGVEESAEQLPLLFAWTGNDASVAPEVQPSAAMKKVQSAYPVGSLKGTKLFACMNLERLLQELAGGKDNTLLSGILGSIGAVTVSSKQGTDVTIELWNNE